MQYIYPGWVGIIRWCAPLRKSPCPLITPQYKCCSVKRQRERERAKCNTGLHLCKTAAACNCSEGLRSKKDRGVLWRIKSRRWAAQPLLLLVYCIYVYIVYCIRTVYYYIPVFIKRESLGPWTLWRTPLIRSVLLTPMLLRVYRVYLYNILGV